jgi:alkylhydroperoxidase family enzyme
MRNDFVLNQRSSRRENVVSWIKEINVEESDGKLKEVYDRILERTENIANILKVHSINPEVLEAHLDLYERVMFGESNLSRSQREMIAVVVSSANACDY